MLEQKIDPAAGKNNPIVESLLQMPKPVTASEAKTAVTVAAREHIVRKKAAKKSSESAEMFAGRILKQFENRYRTVGPQTRDAEVRYVLGMVIRNLGVSLDELRRDDSSAPMSPAAEKAAA